MFTIERRVQFWYGLPLNVQTPGWRHAEAACAQAAGYITALNMANSELAADRDDRIHPSLRLLADSHDLAWQAITARAARAHRLGCARLPTGHNPNSNPSASANHRSAGRSIQP